MMILPVPVHAPPPPPPCCPRCSRPAAKVTACSGCGYVYSDDARIWPMVVGLIAAIVVGTVALFVLLHAVLAWVTCGQFRYSGPAPETCQTLVRAIWTDLRWLWALAQRIV